MIRSTSCHWSQCDLLPNRLAVDSLSNNLHVRQYRGTVDCLRTTYRLEGLRGVYAGAAISMFGAVVFRGMYMGGYDICKSLWDLQHRGVGIRLIAAHVSPLAAL